MAWIECGKTSQEYSKITSFNLICRLSPCVSYTKKYFEGSKLPILFPNYQSILDREIVLSSLLKHLTFTKTAWNVNHYAAFTRLAGVYGLI